MSTLSRSLDVIHTATQPIANLFGYVSKKELTKQASQLSSEKLADLCLTASTPKRKAAALSAADMRLKTLCELHAWRYNAVRQHVGQARELEAQGNSSEARKAMQKARICLSYAHDLADDLILLSAATTR